MFNHPSNQRNAHLKQDTVTFSTYKSAKNCKIVISGANQDQGLALPHSAAGSEN